MSFFYVWCSTFEKANKASTQWKSAFQIHPQCIRSGGKWRQGGNRVNYMYRFSMWGKRNVFMPACRAVTRLSDGTPNISSTLISSQNIYFGVSSFLTPHPHNPGILTDQCTWKFENQCLTVKTIGSQFPSSRALGSAGLRLGVGIWISVKHSGKFWFR